MLSTTVLFGLLTALGARAASKDEWRSRSIYQVLTDRFAPTGTPQHCDNTRKYCGGTWRGLADKLDYIQGMGFDAVWISPTGAGIEGETKWGENYHGYWVVDPASPNPHFGTAEDLKYLSDSLHSRGMYLMVDVVPNHLASTSPDISDQALASKEGGRLMFKQNSDYHPQCDIQWGNAESEQTCWLASDGVALMDLATEKPQVADRLNQFIRDYSATELYDGYRVDAVKHISKQFSHDWCLQGGKFCIGEYYDGSTERPAELTRGEGIDSVFGFGMMWGTVGVFAQDQPMSRLTDYASQVGAYGDASVIGAILDNHDLPRFGSLTTDRSKTFNALTLQFLFGGIPTMYYGFEADITFGQHDPDNRNPLWHYTDYSGRGETYQRIKRLNEIRSKLGQRGDFHTKTATTKAETERDVAFERQGLMIVLSKRGEGQGGQWNIANSGYDAGSDVVDLLTCKTVKINSDGSLPAVFENGLPLAFVSSDVAKETGLCPSEDQTTEDTPSSSLSPSPSSSAIAAIPTEQNSHPDGTVAEQPSPSASELVSQDSSGSSRGPDGQVGQEQGGLQGPEERQATAPSVNADEKEVPPVQGSDEGSEGLREETGYDVLDGEQEHTQQSTGGSLDSNEQQASGQAHPGKTDEEAEGGAIGTDDDGHSSDGTQEGNGPVLVDQGINKDGSSISLPTPAPLNTPPAPTSLASLQQNTTDGANKNQPASTSTTSPGSDSGEPTSTKRPSKACKRSRNRSRQMAGEQ